jgi:hypothetical protein
LTSWALTITSDLAAIGAPIRAKATATARNCLFAMAHFPLFITVPCNRLAGHAAGACYLSLI